MRNVVILAAIGIGVLVGAVWFWRAHKDASIENVPSFYTTENGARTGGVDVPEGSALYANEQYGFSIVLPDTFKTEMYEEGGGARTITYSGSEREFQMYIIPYAESQIESSRVAKDTRGTASQPQEVVIGGGIHALIFTSSDPVFGQLREVWFIHDGYLYEVTTYIQYDSWLAGVLATWRFENTTGS